MAHLVRVRHNQKSTRYIQYVVVNHALFSPGLKISFQQFQQLQFASFLGVVLGFNLGVLLLDERLKLLVDDLLLRLENCKQRESERREETTQTSHPRRAERDERQTKETRRRERERERKKRIL